ncbi:hypothetical protein [Candidatus Arthromitus sp. SFB-rat-Yit]|uniref:hypothetical protein n=1 Tax=Candidatus Arthromitus sp. SFB-rat-Yit TaxID=1041504 RepID=UPI000227A6E1|nr:hypothetical protein [Candidatus Arthromitus sp. SFB-rat-Yit]BAK81120.1 hypothetical protein RATSFB_0558 [Candidatus Arthromitus sp. SFB-rat-Yit]
MGFRDKLTDYYTKSYLKKYGDRLTQSQGNILSVKVNVKRYLWIFYILTAVVVIKPQNSKNIIKCVYKKRRWFKKPSFMNLNQGHLVIVQALRDKKNHEILKILNIRNLSNKQDLIPVDQPQPKSLTKIQRVRK